MSTTSDDPTEQPTEQPAAPAPRSAEEVLAELRADRTNPHLLRGFGPLVALAVLVLLMVLLVPTVAREQIVEQPADATTTTEVDP